MPVLVVTEFLQEERFSVQMIELVDSIRQMAAAARSCAELKRAKFDRRTCSLPGYSHWLQFTQVYSKTCMSGMLTEQIRKSEVQASPY